MVSAIKLMGGKRNRGASSLRIPFRYKSPQRTYKKIYLFYNLPPFEKSIGSTDQEKCSDRGDISLKIFKV